MSARQRSRLAKTKGLDSFLGGGLNAEAEDSDEAEESEEEEDDHGHFSRGRCAITASAFALDSDSSSSDDQEDQEEGINEIEAEREDHDGEPSWKALRESAVEPHGGVAVAVADGDGDEDEDDEKAPLEGKVKGRRASPVAVRSSEEFTINNSEAAPSHTFAASKVIDKNAVKEETNDDQFLDSIISELASAAEAKDGENAMLGDLDGASSPIANLLRCDPRCLKLDQELRRKFGGARIAGGDRENGAPGGRARKTRRGIMPRGMGNTLASGLARKRLAVSVPKDDWPKPPSFVGGGLGMKRCAPPSYLPYWQLKAQGGAAWFRFEMSSSLLQLESKFQTVQANHDPNLLAAFASRVPYHAESLLQLGMVFAHTGQMERASEFVGRSLYVLESAFVEAFKPLDGACRLDASIKANKVYLAAMFRHMQMSGMVGGARTALEVGRLLLSVDPLGDPMGCLLALDSYALASREGAFLLELHRSRLPIGFSVERLSSSRSGGQRREDEDPAVTVQDLPGLSMSVCLAILDATDGGIVAARGAMASALLRFPVMLEPLLEKCGVSPRTATYPQNWRLVMEHPHFGTASDRLPRGHVLLHLSRIFAMRGGETWKYERAQELLYDGAGIALQGLVNAPDTAASRGVETRAMTDEACAATSTARPSGDGGKANPCTPEAEVLDRAYREGSPIEKYLDLPSSDFEEAFVLLPHDANFLHPRLMGANFMNERVQFRLPEEIGGRAGRGDWLDDLLNRGREALLRGGAEGEMGMGRDDGGWLRGPGRRRRRAGGNLDPRAPLAQLFWQTLLPWNVFPTPSRPPPPPPGWL